MTCTLIEIYDKWQLLYVIYIIRKQSRRHVGYRKEDRVQVAGLIVKFRFI